VRHRARTEARFCGVCENRSARAVTRISLTSLAIISASLIALSEWLAQNGCTHIAMEATGIYWKPVWHILADGEFQLVLANSAHVKNVPGRKTDVNDETWLAELVAHGQGCEDGFNSTIESGFVRGRLLGVIVRWFRK
jgi:hypothetical protein